MPRSSKGKGSVSWRQRWAEQTFQIPPSTGYRVLHGAAEYVRQSRSLMLTVSLRTRRPENSGPPSVQHKRVIRWPPGRDIEKVRAALDHEMKLMRGLLFEKRWPEPKLYVGECNLTGMALEDFIDSACAQCTFPTCTLRD